MAKTKSIYHQKLEFLSFWFPQISLVHQKIETQLLAYLAQFLCGFTPFNRNGTPRV